MASVSLSYNLQCGHVSIGLYTYGSIILACHASKQLDKLTVSMLNTLRSNTILNEYDKDTKPNELCTSSRFHIAVVRPVTRQFAVPLLLLVFPIAPWSRVFSSFLFFPCLYLDLYSDTTLFTFLISLHSSLIFNYSL